MTPEAEEARDRLLFHLEHQEGFWFALVVGDDPRPRAQLRETAEAWCGEHGREFHVHAPHVHQLAGLAAELSRGAPSGVHWIRTDGPGALIEQWEAAASQLVMAMNERREAYRRRLDGAVILEGRESLKRLTRELAPDMFSIRAFIAEPGVHTGPRMDVASVWRDPMDSLQGLLSHLASDPERELERASRLRTISSHGGFGAWARSMVTAAFGFLMAGRAEEARRCAESIVEGASGILDRDPLDNGAREAYRDGVAINGIALSALGRAEALWWIERAIVIFHEEVDAKDPVVTGSFGLLLQGLHASRGNLLLYLGNLDGAQEALQVRLDVARVIAHQAPAVAEWQIELMDACRDIAKVLVERGDLANAESALRESVALAGEHTRRSGDPRWQLEFSRSCTFLGSVLWERGDLAGAIEALQSARGALEQLVQEDTDIRLRTVLGRALVLLAGSLSDLGDLNASQAVVERCLSMLRHQPDGVLNGSIEWIAVMAHSVRAENALKLGDTRGAESDLLAGWLRLRSRLVELDDFASLNAIAGLHVEVAARSSLAEDSDADAANAWINNMAGYYKRAVKLCERAFEVAPRDLSTRMLLDAFYHALARLLRLQGRHRASRRIRRKRRALRRTRPSPPAKP